MAMICPEYSSLIGYLACLGVNKPPHGGDVGMAVIMFMVEGVLLQCGCQTGQNVKRLAPSRHTKDRKHLQSASVVNRHKPQNKHQAPSRAAQERRCMTPTRTTAVYASSTAAARHHHPHPLQCGCVVCMAAPRLWRRFSTRSCPGCLRGCDHVYRVIADAC